MPILGTSREKLGDECEIMRGAARGVLPTWRELARDSDRKVRFSVEAPPTDFATS